MTLTPILLLTHTISPHRNLLSHPDVTFVLHPHIFEVLCRHYRIEVLIDDDVKWQRVAQVATAARDHQMTSATTSISRTGTMAYDYDYDDVHDINHDSIINDEMNTTTSTPPPPPPPRSRSPITTTATTINATWSWLARFDVLFALASPYDTLDNTMRALPTGPQLEPYRRAGAR